MENGDDTFVTTTIPTTRRSTTFNYSLGSINVRKQLVSPSANSPAVSGSATLISRARAHGQDVRVTAGVNARRRFVPPLPINYAGNCVFSALSTYSKNELLPEDEFSISPATLIKFALRIRSSILKLNSDYLRDTIDFIAEQENLSRVAVSTKYILRPDLMFTSWANLGLYDAEFDGVHPVFAGVPKVPFLHVDGKVIISESANGVEGLDVLVFLECSAMDRLKSLCGRVEYLHVH